jgi:hypothetical protein
MTEISIGSLLALMALPSAITGFCFWLLERQIKKRDKKQSEREEARKENELLLIKSTGAAIALGEATAMAMQRIPDAHCNGDMHAALEYAKQVKHEQKDFLAKQGINALYD